MTIVFYLALLLVPGLGDTGNANYWNDVAQKELQRSLDMKNNMKVAKNIILFLGDGMSLSTVTAARILKGQIRGMLGEEGLLFFETFPHIGLSKTYTDDRQTPDSAGTGTAFLCGVKANFGTLGVDTRVIRSNCTSQKGGNVSSILKWAHDSGKSTGIVTTTRITHATPAAAYAHSADRNWEGDSEMANVTGGCKDIALQLVEDNPFIEVILGGGRRYFMKSDQKDPHTKKLNGKYGRKDKDLIEIWKNDKKRRKKTYQYVWKKDLFDKVKPADTNYLLGLFNSGHMNYELERNNGSNGEPSLAEMTRKAIQILGKNKNGFFLLVEGGRIDHGHHDNMGKRALYETLSFDLAVKESSRLVSAKDTMTVVTADHSFVFSMVGYPYRGNSLFGLVTPIEWGGTSDNLAYTVLAYANGPGFNISSSGKRPNLTNVDTESPEYKQQSGVPMEWGTHDGQDVPIYANGPMAHLFHGVHEQNYIAHVMAYAACIGENKDHCRKIPQATSSKDYMQTAAVPMESSTHDAQDVPIYAQGAMAHLFHGVHEQNYIPHAMAYAACIGSNKNHCKKKTSDTCGAITFMAPLNNLSLFLLSTILPRLL